MKQKKKTAKTKSKIIEFLDQKIKEKDAAGNEVQKKSSRRFKKSRK